MPRQGRNPFSVLTTMLLLFTPSSSAYSQGTDRLNLNDTVYDDIQLIRTPWDNWKGKGGMKCTVSFKESNFVVYTARDVREFTRIKYSDIEGVDYMPMKYSRFVLHLLSIDMGHRRMPMMLKLNGLNGRDKVQFIRMLEIKAGRVVEQDPLETSSETDDDLENMDVKVKQGRGWGQWQVVSLRPDSGSSDERVTIAQLPSSSFSVTDDAQDQQPEKEQRKPRAVGMPTIFSYVPTLMVVCQPWESPPFSVWVVWPTSVGQIESPASGDVPIQRLTIRFSSSPEQTEDWRVEHVAILGSQAPQLFASELMRHEMLTVRLHPSGGSHVIATFDLKRARKALRHPLKACGVSPLR